jgi:SAM-dependent methyltransferase
VVDLGLSPLCESFRTAEELDEGETFYPLRVLMCDTCKLVQLAEYVAPADIFREYAYFSSFSESWVEHAREYATSMIERLGLGAGALVVELGSNDGYLLRHFVERGVPVLGIDPAENVAAAAVASGVPTLARFFGTSLADELVAAGRQADLIVANNVLAQVPDINDFVGGAARLLRPDGLLSIEVPHLLRLLDGNQFDTIYHEHFSYFSLATVGRILAAHGLAVVDVAELPSHGGSLRISARHRDERVEPSGAVARLLDVEREAGLEGPDAYEAFGRRVEETRYRMVELLVEARRRGQQVAGYGAPGKANTFLNYCAIRADLLPYTVDRNPYKHGRFTPGTHVPIHSPERIAETRPDIIWILPWNLAREISVQLEYAREWGARFVVAIPEPAFI